MAQSPPCSTATPDLTRHLGDLRRTCCAGGHPGAFPQASALLIRRRMTGHEHAVVTEDERDAAQHLLEFYRQAQEGVFSRAQLRECLIAKHDIERMLRRRKLRRVHPRVYIDHTGPLTRRQREWAALLYAEPAALCWRLGDRDSEVIHVAVPHDRQVRPLVGLRIHRVRGFQQMVDGRRLPALDLAHDALCMAHEAETELDAVAVVAAAVAAKVSGRRLRAALQQHHSLRRRRFVATLIDDVAEGTDSVLQHGYLVHVERPHGLPPLRRQARRTSSRGTECRDGEYEASASSWSWTDGSTTSRGPQATETRPVTSMISPRAEASRGYATGRCSARRARPPTGSARRCRSGAGSAPRGGAVPAAQSILGDLRRTWCAGGPPGPEVAGFRSGGPRLLDCRGCLGEGVRTTELRDRQGRHFPAPRADVGCAVLFCRPTSGTARPQIPRRQP